MADEHRSADVRGPSHLPENILVKWLHMVDQGKRAGFTFPKADLLIAATAVHHDLTVVTRDTRDYERANVPVLNPWLTP